MVLSVTPELKAEPSQLNNLKLEEDQKFPLKENLNSQTDRKTSKLFKKKSFDIEKV